MNEDVAGGSLAARWGARAETVMQKRQESASEERSPSAAPTPIEEPEVYNVDLMDLEPSPPRRTIEPRPRRSSIVHLVRRSLALSAVATVLLTPSVRIPDDITGLWVRTASRVAQAWADPAAELDIVLP